MIRVIDLYRRDLNCAITSANGEIQDDVAMMYQELFNDDDKDSQVRRKIIDCSDEIINIAKLLKTTARKRD